DERIGVQTPCVNRHYAARGVMGRYSGSTNYLNATTDDAPGTPRRPTYGGSDIDVYRYAMRTAPERWLHFYWDAYGQPATPAQAANGWLDQTGSIYVTSIALNGNLPNP
ncbi:hypothetical protein JW916_01625, partial [Candidatus Sumerlaeota bacterium]|nr:hypothetical protein [Candidatus Sumerlaeota bacterium]